MGFKRNDTLKCHTCKNKRAIGGSKKFGNTEATAKKYGWKFVETKKALVYLCPNCAKKYEGHKNYRVIW